MARPGDDEKKHPEKYFFSPRGHARDRIRIHESQKIPREGQFVSLNGYGFLIKPGEEVDIPRPVRLLLDTLVEIETIQGEDGKEYCRDIQRFPYVLVKEDVGVPESAEKEPVAIDVAGAAGGMAFESAPAG